MAGPGGGRGGVGAGDGDKKARGNSETVSCWGGEGQRVEVKVLDRLPPPHALHLTGDPGGRRSVLGTVGGSKVCSGLAALSSWVRHGLLSLAVTVGLAVAGAEVGELALCPPGDGVEGVLPLGCTP